MNQAVVNNNIENVKRTMSLMLALAVGAAAAFAAEIVDGFHATVTGVVVKKGQKDLTIKVETIKAEKNNTVEKLDELVGKEIKSPLTFNPYFRDKVQAQFEKVKEGDKVEAQLQKTKLTKVGPGLLVVKVVAEAGPGGAAVAAPPVAAPTPPSRPADPNAPPFPKPDDRKLMQAYQKRVKFWQNRAQDQNAVVFVGDSITDWWEGLDKAFPGMKVANRGIAGDSTTKLLARLKVDVLDLNPRAVVLLIGCNDIRVAWAGEHPKNTADRIEQIVQQIQALPNKPPVFLCLVMPRDMVGKDGTALRTKDILGLNELLKQRYASHPQVKLVDTFTPFLGADGNINHQLFKDGLHPSTEGYEVWRKTLAPFLESLP